MDRVFFIVKRIGQQNFYQIWAEDGPIVVFAANREKDKIAITFNNESITPDCGEIILSKKAAISLYHQLKHRFVEANWELTEIAQKKGKK